MFVYCYLRKNLFPRADGLPVPKFTDNFAKAFLHFIQRFKKLVFKCTDEELKEAYDIAVQLVEPFAKFSWEEQVQGIMKTFREYFENGMTYSTSTPYYNDLYGYLVLKTASCAGCTRTTGLCLNILGIPYEHGNPDSWTHQWRRVDVNGTYWICDAYGLYCGPEPAPHTHPRLS